MLLASALPEGRHLGVSLPNLHINVFTLSGDRADIAAIFETLQANAVLLSALHTPPKRQHTAVPLSGASISRVFCPHV